ncbi:MAG TPA: hypothetical protein DCS91_13195, partial [Microcoleaceae bacterium UBA11344]|nr:hypothetical protein [Microcoleaceae cyanobacterium UBA11344]
LAVAIYSFLIFQINREDAKDTKKRKEKKRKEKKRKERECRSEFIWYKVCTAHLIIIFAA